MLHEQLRTSTSPLGQNISYISLESSSYSKQQENNIIAFTPDLDFT